MDSALSVLMTDPSRGMERVYWASAAPWKVREAVMRGGVRGSEWVRERVVARARKAVICILMLVLLMM